MFTFKSYNIADWFSFYRIAAAPFLGLMLWLDYRYLFCTFLLLSYLTDAIDGYLARTFKIVSARGSQLDSLGDQITFGLGLIGLYFFENEFVIANLYIIIIAFIPYLLQMLIAYQKYGKATAFHTYLAKSSAVLQSVFLVSAFYFYPNYYLFYAMIVVGILETLEEITLIFMYKDWVADVTSIFMALKDERRLASRDSTSS